MRKLKTLTVAHLDRLVRENKPIYVVNTSALPSGDKGMVIVNFFDGTRREFFKMPPTFIPMAITDSIPPQKVLESKDFRQCLLKGMLTLIEPASAEAYLSTQEAQDEYESLVLSEHSAKAQNLDINRTVNKRTQVHHSNHEGSGPIQDVSAVDTVSNKVRGLMESMIAGTLTTKEVLIQLRRHQSALHSVDFSYVIANSNDQELKKWAKAGLTRTTRDEFADDDDDDIEDENGNDDESNYEEDDEDILEPTKIKKNRGRPKLAAKGVKPELKKKVSNDYSSVFDFKNDTDGVTPEELLADEKAKALAMNNQNLYGESMYQKEINNILSGKV